MKNNIPGVVFSLGEAPLAIGGGSQNNIAVTRSMNASVAPQVTDSVGAYGTTTPGATATVDADSDFVGIADGNGHFVVYGIPAGSHFVVTQSASGLGWAEFTCGDLTSNIDVGAINNLYPDLTVVCGQMLISEDYTRPLLLFTGQEVTVHNAAGDAVLTGKVYTNGKFIATGVVVLGEGPYQVRTMVYGTPYEDYGVGFLEFYVDIVAISAGELNDVGIQTIVAI